MAAADTGTSTDTNMTAHAPEYEPEPEPEYVAYADEAQYNFGRYRGLGVVSLRAEDAAGLSAEVDRLLRASEVGECKWEKVRSARTRFAAKKLLRWALDAAQRGALRVDVLLWDTHAAQRAGRGLPHIKNLRRLYAHLIERVVTARWPGPGRWRIYPDEQDAIPWEAIRQHVPAITNIAPRPSHEEPLIQLADLFTGLGVYSRSAYDTYEQWLCLPAEERALPASEDTPPLHISGADRQRCLVLDDFFTQCKLRMLGVSLRTNRGLRTYDPARPITFRWHDG